MAARCSPAAAPRAASASALDPAPAAPAVARVTRPLDTPARNAGFPRSARVRAPREFKSVFDGGRRSAHPLLSVHVLADASPPRLGLAVSRKVDPRAVGRNRIKRVLRDSFRHLRGRLQPGSYVVVARPAARQVDAATLRAAFTSVLQRSGALSPAAEAGTMRDAGGPMTASPPVPSP